MSATWRIFADWGPVTGMERDGTSPGFRSSISPNLAHRGPSPRGRGSHLLELPILGDEGSIPAWAGEPSPSGLALTERKVHPRVGGGALPTAIVPTAARGPSPRRRGSPCLRLAGAHRMGPSPRGRGSRTSETSWWCPPGSIPAWAGEPRTSVSPPRSIRVHPRVGGGAESAKPNDDDSEGPSPRGRGSQPEQVRLRHRARSIPAWAGEPPRATPPSPPRTVHPRVGGGA